MTRSFFTKLLSVSIVFFALFLVRPAAAQAESIDAPTETQSGVGFKVQYSGADAGECYVWRIQNRTNGEYVKSTGQNQPACDKEGPNYFDYEIARSEGEVFISPLPAGDYTITLHIHGENFFGRRTLDKVAEDSVTVVESGITPSPSPSPITPIIYNCDNRPSSCSKDKFPQCQQAGSGGILYDCGSPDYSCKFDSGGKRFCAYPATVTPPPANTDNNCSITRIEGGQVVGGKCAPGWRQSTFGGDPNCVCIPDNAPDPTPDPTDPGNQCPVCNDPDYQSYIRTTDSCHKDSGTSSDNKVPDRDKTCLNDTPACNPGKGCQKQEGAKVCPICPAGYLLRGSSNPICRKAGADSVPPDISQSCSPAECRRGLGCNVELPDAPLAPCKVYYRYDGNTFVTLTPPPREPGSDVAGEAEWARSENVDGCLEVDTAIGGISVDPGKFVAAVMGALLSVSGGIATILIMISGYQLMTSTGDPEKIGHARERLTSAIVGLLFIIFSVVILQIIGVDLLRIPGFSP